MKVSYYPGCTLHGTAKEYGQSVTAVSKALGIELQEVDDWSCCGATSAHSTNFALSVALPARNLAVVEKGGLDVMVPCAACFNRFKSAQHYLKEDAALKRQIEKAIGAPYQGTATVRNPIDIICNDIGLEAVARLVTKELRGLKPVAYYGCLLLRPPEVCSFEDAENPVLLDKLMDVLGAEPKFWSYKTDCCGGSLTLTKKDIVVKMVDKLMTMAREAGANCLVTACPICMANLDMRASENVRLPAFYFTELMTLAMGLEGPARWFKMHNVDARPFLEARGLL